MKLIETYNIHKNLNSIFPFFKSKRLCKKGIHNFIINPHHIVEPHYYEEYDKSGTMIVAKVTNYQHIDLTNLKCACCGKEVELDDLKGEWEE